MQRSFNLCIFQERTFGQFKAQSAHQYIDIRFNFHKAIYTVYLCIYLPQLHVEALVHRNIVNHKRYIIDFYICDLQLALFGFYFERLGFKQIVIGIAGLINKDVKGSFLSNNFRNPSLAGQ
ncbi:hypothetical protein D9M68_781150 [compost metagenome]